MAARCEARNEKGGRQPSQMRCVKPATHVFRTDARRKPHQDAYGNKWDEPEETEADRLMAWNEAHRPDDDDARKYGTGFTA